MHCGGDVLLLLAYPLLRLVFCSFFVYIFLLPFSSFFRPFFVLFSRLTAGRIGNKVGQDGCKADRKSRSIGQNAV